MARPACGARALAGSSTMAATFLATSSRRSAHASAWLRVDRSLIKELREIPASARRWRAASTWSGVSVLMRLPPSSLRRTPHAHRWTSRVGCCRFRLGSAFVDHCSSTWSTVRLPSPTMRPLSRSFIILRSFCLAFASELATARRFLPFIHNWATQRPVGFPLRAPSSYTLPSWFPRCLLVTIEPPFSGLRGGLRQRTSPNADER